MKQKKVILALAASAMIAAGFTSCSVDDNPIYQGSTPKPVVDQFDEGSEIQNGSCEGSLDANFWCHEWRTSAKQFDGNANIVIDPEDRNNHCVAVVVRSNKEAYAAGNGTTTDNGATPLKEDLSNFADWDSQFFITLGADKALKANDKIRLTMRVKADKPQSAGTQSHTAPGSYIHWYGVGDVNFTTEWTEFDSKWITVGPGDDWGKAKAGIYTIAFNLAKGEHNTVYFDDIRVEVERYDPLDEGNAVKGGSFEYIKESDAYWCHEWRTPDAQFDGRANIIVDPANEKNHCAAVVVRSFEEAVAAGNPVLADGSKPATADNFAGWDSQFFISFGEKQALKAGDKIQLKMKVKADKELKGVGTQAHGAPGAYMDWYCVGNVDFTTEWTEFVSEVIPVEDNPGGWPRTSTKAGAYTIAFNLTNGIHNTVYFDDIQVLITK